VDRFFLVAAGIGILSLIGFAVLFSPDMRGNERALLDVTIAAALGGAGLTVLLRRGVSARPNAIITVVLLLGAVVFAILSFEDLRIDRGNKKAFLALGLAAASGAAAITSVIARRPVGISSGGITPPAA
jgi:hypothetical protein